MKFNKLLILGFLLITLVALPVSFAADISVTDLNPNDVGGTDLSLKEANQSISSTSLEDEIYAFDTSSLLDNETVYLNGSYAGSDEKGTLENPYKDINNATNALLSSNKTNLFLANGNYKINNHFDVDSKNINIIGESASGVTINCNNTTYLQFIKSNSNICDLTIYNSYSTGEDAVIWTELSNITLCNVVFTNNLANSPGGIILTRGGTFKLINCSIKNNLIDYGNGGISGGIIYSDNNLIIINSSFENNTIKSSTYSGGAIFAKGNLEFINSSMSHLYVVSDDIIQGAFIYYDANNILKDKGYIINSSFEKSNFSYVKGLIINYGYLIMNNINISNNYVFSMHENDTLVDNNSMIMDNVNIFNNTFVNIYDLDIIMNFLYKNGYFNISEDLPSRYDLRDYNLTTPVKNQGANDCWAFATMAVLESYLLKNWNETFDLSEINLRNIMSKTGINGSEWDPIKDGGNDVLALAYLLRWSGAVNETVDPYISSNIYSNIYDSIVHVQDVIYIPLRLNYTDNDQIKYAIMKYGAVWTEMHASGVAKLNTYSTESLDSDHAVTIVGWDDNYSASKFDITPPGNGAFIVRNSWGSGWGDNGYFYVSYYDASFAGFAANSKFSGFVFSNVENVNNYNSIYYYDSYGNDYKAAGYLSDTAWFANQFTANDKEILSAFGIYTYGDSNYTTNIYINDKLVYTQEGIIYNAGYHTIRLNKTLLLNQNDIFRIEVKLITPNCSYPIAIEAYLANFVNATANPNESFVSKDGENWTDLTSILSRANVCIKAYTVNYLMEVNSSKIEAYVDDVIILNITVKDLKDNIIDLSEGNISIIFPDFTVISPTVNKEGISFIIPNSNISGNLVILFTSQKYPLLFANLNLTLIKYDVDLEVSPNVTVFVGDEDNFIITVTDNEGNPVTSGNVVLYQNGYEIANFELINGTIIWYYKYSSSGEYNISIVYTGSKKYFGVNDNRTITVNKLDTKLSLESINTSALSSVELVATVISNSTVYGNVTFYVGDEKLGTVELVDGVAKINYTCGPGGNFTIKAIYNGNNKFKSSQNSSNLIVNKIPVTMTIKQNNTYYKSAFITITLSKAINGQKITLKFSNGKTATVSTNSKGVATYYVPFAVGSYTVTGSASNSYYDIKSVDSYKISIKKVTATITTYKLTTTYKSGKYFQVKVTNPKGQIMVGVKLKLKVYTGSKYKTVYITTGTNGIAKYGGSSLSIAKHKIVVSSAESTTYMAATAKTNYLTVKKGITTVYAPVVKNKYKSNKYFKVTVKNKASGKVISGLYLKIKVYTGKKYKTYKVKTNSKGIVQINTKSLKKGSHKVVITTTSKKYSVKKSGYLIKII